ncbi:amidohydrolase [Alkalihalobacillus sp. CinArs1]|uniref:amidohydrolase n=1 Tax=Alkalihalobacillus sp. CinArs1 TaxID=2995314 RepID=UPI0022DE0C90|nr:amidohydrolase [Alkalihalobacillus sp. CinArs1]
MYGKMIEQLETEYPQMVEWRRYFHENPELSFQEVETPKKIAGFLRDIGIEEIEEGVGGRGIVAKIHGGLPGKTIALRADFDALPIQDAKDVPYKSKVDGVSHACGHDAHTSTLLHTAKVLHDNREHLNGTIVLIHQFAEEQTPGGAKPMIEAGCLEGVDEVYGTHLWSMFPVGSVFTKSGPLMASSDRFTIEIDGKGGHGALPHETIDPIVCGSAVVQNLQQVVSRNVNPLESAVLSLGAFESGGPFNVIPSHASILGTVRTFSRDVQVSVKKRMTEIVEHTGKAYGATCSLNYEEGYPALFNHEKETTYVKRAAEDLFGAEHSLEMDPMMGGEDFAYYLLDKPGAFFFTGAGHKDAYPHHHPNFDIEETAMLQASKMFIKLIEVSHEEGVSDG